MDFKHSIVSIESIDLEDRTYLFSYPKRTVFLKESIKSVGLIQPPVLFSKKGFSRLKIICGEGRINACQELGISEIPAFIISEKSDKELLLLALESNLFRTLNIIEKAEFINKALKFFSVDEVIKLLPKLNLSPSFHWVEFLQAINRLEDTFKKLLIDGELNPKIAKTLAYLSLEEKKKFLELLKKLDLSFSEQREVLEKLLDYKKRKNLSCLLPDELKKVLDIEDFNKRKKEFFEILKALYYPHYVSKLKKISPIVKNFREKHININFSPYFEKKELEIQFKIMSFEEFEKKLKFIEENKEKIKKILNEI
ncbi:MAG: ParB N-terminal domain-containing protein [Thermodesulfobacterium sp.]|nr:ParB N-terminal domain-containing protein [Thermodesulfobacterium sp.]